MTKNRGAQTPVETLSQASLGVSMGQNKAVLACLS